MNNTQLALLLQGYAFQLNQILDNLKVELAETDLERFVVRERGKWIGKGDKPEDHPFFTNKSDWEWVDKPGSLICLEGLREFIVH